MDISLNVVQQNECKKPPKNKKPKPPKPLFCEWFVYRNSAKDEFAYFPSSEDQRRKGETHCEDCDFIWKEQL